jgi:hypothetical protein
MGKPQGEIWIKSLAGVGTVRRVEPVDTSGQLAFRHAADGLYVTVPDGLSHAYGMALRINGDNLV